MEGILSVCLVRGALFVYDHLLNLDLDWGPPRIRRVDDAAYVIQEYWPPCPNAELV